MTYSRELLASVTSDATNDKGPHRSSVNFKINAAPNTKLYWEVLQDNKPSTASFNVYYIPPPASLKKLTDDPFAWKISNGTITDGSNSDVDYYIGDPHDDGDASFTVNVYVANTNTLKTTCILGSHDAGMYKASIVTECFTKTQSINMYQQLEAGAQYFDLRPVIDNETLYTGHYEVKGGIPFGSLGGSLDEIFTDIKNYLYDHQQLVILKFSHYLDLKTAGGFNQSQMAALIKKLKDSLGDYLFIKNTNTRLADIPFDQFFPDSKGKVIAVFHELGYKPEPLSGIYTYADYGSKKEDADLIVFDQYSTTDNLSTMISGQFNMLQTTEYHTKVDLFLLSWTLTGISSCILPRAKEANSVLVPYLIEANRAGIIAPATYPNILYVDDIGYMTETATDVVNMNIKAPLAAMVYKSADDILDAGLYISFLFDDKWYGDKKISELSTIGASSDQNPNCTLHDNNLYIVYRHPDESIYYIYWDGITWKGNTQIQIANRPIKSSSTPGILEYRGKLYIVYKGDTNDNNLYYAWLENGSWYGGQKIQVTDNPMNPFPQSTRSPNIAIYNGIMYIVYKGSSTSNLYTAYFDGYKNKWFGNTKISDQPGGISPKSDYSPGITVFNNKMYLAYKGTGTNNALYTAYFDGSKKSWFGDTKISAQPGGINPESNDSPCITFYNTKMYMVYKGLSTTLYSACMDINGKWSGNNPIEGNINPKSTWRPAMTVMP